MGGVTTSPTCDLLDLVWRDYHVSPLSKRLLEAAENYSFDVKIYAHSNRVGCDKVLDMIPSLIKINSLLNLGLWGQISINHSTMVSFRNYLPIFIGVMKLINLLF